MIFTDSDIDSILTNEEGGATMASDGGVKFKAYSFFVTSDGPTEIILSEGELLYMLKKVSEL